MPVSKAKIQANKRWEAKNCRQIRLVIPIEQADRLEEFCKKTGQSKNGFIKAAIDEKMERES